ncbi:hypothetical protein LEL_02093 [Akanthomyces lecanii RCEF 1005]|uniref:Uncharacterized protein n=1 Tax=Akanthomyces lecanii RCEF 1005 TaxID=1081108 RepID=A0A162L0F1_CORDF|nr:hypothetical protein LEL_02093 [Akanthomyces lecanii RCEF 1005]
MVKLTTICFAAVVALAGFAEAKTCTTGVIYCGINLRRRDYPPDELVRALRAGRVAPDPRLIDDSLFRCIGGMNKKVVFAELCRGGCVDGDTDGTDHCNRDPNILDGKRHLDTEPTLQLD